MPIYQLNEELIFPHPELASKEGILAIGGDLSAERLLLAYCNGIFPWFSEGEPILWWSPDPRFVLFPSQIHISKSMKKVLKKQTYRITYDNCFKEVMTQCGKIREDKEGTWINRDMIEAYYKLHQMGFAHSVEAWYEERLVGGLYGIVMGKCFFGESMFSIMDNASKAAFITLCEKLNREEYKIIDCQVYTQYLESLGAQHISRKNFLSILKEWVNKSDDEKMR